jgi:hypothetical protein
MVKKARSAEAKSLADFDINALEKEWHRQPRLMEKQVREAVELEEAACAQRIRENPEKYIGSDKVTEAAIKEAKLLHPKYQKAKQKLIDAAFRKDLAEGLVVALNHRKKALEKEVDLWNAGYFSSPKQPKEGRVTLPRRKMRDDEDDDD